MRRAAAEQARPFLRAEAYDNFLHGERYFKGPDQVSRFISCLPMMEIPKRYVVFKPLREVDPAVDDPKVIVFFADPGFRKNTGPGSVSPYDHYIKVILDPNGPIFVILDHNYVVPIGRKIFGNVVTYFSGSDKNDLQNNSAFQNKSNLCSYQLQ